MVPISKIEAGIARYLDAEMLTQLPKDGWRRVAVGAAISIVIKRASAAAQGMTGNKMLNDMGILMQDGNVDLETLRDAIKAQIPDCGMKETVPILGTLTFYRRDVDTLYEYIMAS